MEIDSSNSKTERLREKSREYLTEHRSTHRKRIFNDKRLHLNAEEDKFRDLSVGQMKELTEKWRKSKCDRQIAAQLKRAFSQGTSFIENFLKVDGALAKLIGALTGNDADLQLEAGACFVNLFLADHHVIKRAVRDTAPYLMTYLSSSSLPLKELCLWALGNIAADCPECCKSLKEKNFLTAVIGVIRLHDGGSKSSGYVDAILHSATFSLVRYMSNVPDDWSSIICEAGFAECLPSLLGNPFRETVLEEALFATFYLSTRVEFSDFLIRSGCIESAINSCRQLVESHLTENDEFSAFSERHSRIMTFLVRTLADTCAVLNVNHVATDCWRPVATLLPCLLRSSYPHLQKESLWLLANMTAVGFPWILALYQSEKGLLSEVIQMLVNPVCPSPGITLQCLTCLVNFLTATGSEDASIVRDIRQRLPDDVLVQLLSRPDPSECRHALALFALLLLYSSFCSNGTPEMLGYIKSLEKMHSLAALDDDFGIRAMALHCCSLLPS